MNVLGAEGSISTLGDEEGSVIYLLENILAIFPGVWLQRQSSHIEATKTRRINVCAKMHKEDLRV
jgi:hypothetical protein